MPRSVIVLRSDAELFEKVRATLGTDSRFIEADDTLHCDGSGAPLTNIFPVANDPVDWEDWSSATSEMPDPRTMTALVFECRSPEWVAEVGMLLARDLDSPLWFVDSRDRAWLADQVDPNRIALS